MLIPRISIRSLVFAVLLIAGDCAALRLGLGGPAPYGLMVGILAILPMSNIVAVACYRGLAARTSGRAFLLGFGLSGAVAVLACFYFCLIVEASELHRINSRFANLFNILNIFIQRYIIYFRDSNTREIYHAVLNLSLLAFLTLTPQMFVALSGGWLARRYAARLRPTISRPSPTR